MAEPLVVRVMREFKEAILLRESAQMAQMAERYLRIEERTEAAIMALAYEFDERRRNGETITEAALWRMQRYKELQAQLEAEVNGYMRDYADPAISTWQREIGGLGIDQANAAIIASYDGGFSPFFNRLPVSAIDNMIGLAGDGSPLRKLLAEGYPDALDGMVKALIDSTALGINPRETARYMRDGLGAGLDRALTIARTEQLRVYREASRQQYEASGIVHRFKRICARNENTCMACLLSDGEIFEVGQELTDHPNGRCSTIPIVDGRKEPTWQSGKEWFAEQDEETQRAQMGGEYYDAWKDGAFNLEQLRSTAHSDTWGDSPQVTSLSSLLN